jgi:hypothetical protein
MLIWVVTDPNQTQWMLLISKNNFQHAHHITALMNRFSTGRSDIGKVISFNLLPVPYCHFS